MPQMEFTARIYTDYICDAVFTTTMLPCVHMRLFASAHVFLCVLGSIQDCSWGIKAKEAKGSAGLFHFTAGGVLLRPPCRRWYAPNSSHNGLASRVLIYSTKTVFLSKEKAGLCWKSMSQDCKIKSAQFITRVEVITKKRRCSELQRKWFKYLFSC